MVDLVTLRDRLDLPATVMPDEELDAILSACQEMQAAVTVPVVSGSSPALEEALIRRVGRQIAAKGIPLGAAANEWGSFYIPGWNDPIIAAQEADHLRGGFA